MKKYFLLILILALFNFERPLRAEPNVKISEGLNVIQGEIERFYEGAGGEWSSSVVIKDYFGKKHDFRVDPFQTLVRRGTQIQELEALMGGMRVTIVYRTSGEERRASVINISGTSYVSI